MTKPLCGAAVLTVLVPGSLLPGQTVVLIGGQACA